MEALSSTPASPALDQPPRRGLLIVISGPSGVGKGTIVRHLMSRMPLLKLSVSVTTRAPRPGEREGESYFFKGRPEFQGMVERGELLEHAQFGSNFYGTPRRFVEEQLARGEDVVLEIDIKGAIQVKERIPDGVYVFVLPPTLEELAARLIKRSTEAEEAMRQRLQMAQEELDYLPMYDYQLVNEDLPHAVKQVESIIVAEHCRVRRKLASL